MTQQSDTRQSTTTTAHDAFMKATHLPTFSLPSNLNGRMVANKQHNNRPRLSSFRSKWLTQQSLEETAFAEDKLIDINLPPISKENLDTTLLSKEIHIIVAIALTLALASVFFLALSHAADSPLYSTFLAGWLLFLASFMFVGWSDMIMYMRTFALVMLAVTGWSYSHGLHKTALPQALSCVLFVVAERLNNTYGRIQDDIVKQRERYRAGAEEAIAQSLERYSNQRSLFLSTISQEIRDAGLMVMATLEQFSPSSILSNTHELLSACSIAVPIASISAINTTIQEACHISSHLNLISKMLKDSHTDCTIPEDKIMKLTVNNEFDAGEVIQNVGDALAGMSAKLGVHFVIYHVDNGFYYPNVIGNEDAIKHALINLLRNMLEGCTPGACIELGLLIAPIPDTPKVKVTFDITQNASPAIPIGLSTAFIPNANFTSQLLSYIGGKMELEDLGKNRTRVEVSLELYPGSNTDQRLLLIEKPSQILEKQLANIRFSNEPTLEDLSAFLAQLKGVKLILHAPEKSMFAKHLTSCLTTWNTDISHLSILGYTEDAEGNSSSSSGGGDAATLVGSDSEASSVNSQPLKTPLEKHATLSPASSRSINSANTNSSKIPSPAIEEDHIHSIPPAFILIDDDVHTLEKKLREFRDKSSIQQHQSPLQQPQSQPPTVHSQRRHHRSKSRQNGHENAIPQSTVAIIFFTSLINYKRVRDTIHWFNSVGQSPSLPRIVVVPKPAGPRRFLTALHTAWHNAIVEPQFIPIATSPLSPFVSPHCFPSPGILQDPNSSGSSVFMTPGTSLMTPHDGASRSSPGRRPPGAPPTSVLRAGLHSPSNLYLESEKGGYFFDSAASRPSKLNTTSPLLSAATTNATKKLASPVLMPLNTTTTSNTSAIPGLNSSSSGDNGSSVGDTASNTGSIGNMNAPPNEIKRRIRSQSNAYAVPTVGRRNLVDLSLPTVVSPSTLLSANHVDPTKRITYPEVEVEGQTASSCTNSAGAGATDMCQHPSASLMEDTHVPIMETPPAATKATTTPSSHGVNQDNSSSNTMTPDKSNDANNNNNAAIMDANLAQQTTVPSSNATNTTATTTVVPPPPSTAAATAVPQGSMMKPKSTKFNFKLSNRKRKEKTNGFDNKQSPPITVLIVEDNMINQAILSTWMKKRSIKFSVASDGKEAVEKWKGGGFHLILMDIQLPVMDGIAATKLIRSIEKERKIGVLPSNAEEQQQQEQQQEEEELMKKETNEEKNHGNSVSSFQSPVIIVALTASSLESDRRAALAAGCNDFLTKPVSLEWLEKKIMEWGCMQALIDFEGWRKWKRSRDNNNNSKGSSQEPVFPSSPAVATFRLRKDPMASLVDKETHAREKEQLELRTKEMLKDESRAIILLGINKRRMSMAISDHRSSPASRSNTPPPPPLLPPSHTPPPPPPPPSSASPASQMTKSGFGLSSNPLRKRASDPDLYTRGLSIPKQVEAREHKRMLEEERLLNQWEDSTSISSSSSSSSNNNNEEEE